MQLASGSLWDERARTEQRHATTQNSWCLNTTVVRPETSHVPSPPQQWRQLKEAGKNLAAAPTSPKAQGINLSHEK